MVAKGTQPTNQGQGAANTSPGQSGSTTANEIASMRGEIGMLNVKIAALESRMDSEIRTVMAEFKSAEADRTIEYRELATRLDTVTQSLPSKSTFWKMGGALFGGLVAAAALAWSIFDTGAGMTGAFADKVLETKQQQDNVNQKLDRLLEEHDRGEAQESAGAGQNVAIPGGASNASTGGR